MIDRVGSSDSIECEVRRNGKVISRTTHDKPKMSWWQKLFRLRLIFVSIRKGKGVLIIINDGKIVIKEKSC